MVNAIKLKKKGLKEELLTACVCMHKIYSSGSSLLSGARKCIQTINSSLGYRLEEPVLTFRKVYTLKPLLVFFRHLMISLIRRFISRKAMN